MDVLEKDLEWWLAEARANPDAAGDIIAALAARVITLQRSADALRAENAMLRRGSGQAYLEQIGRLRSALGDVRRHAAAHGLDIATLCLASFTGEALQFDASLTDGSPARIAMPPDRTMRDVRPVYLARTHVYGQLLAVTSSFRGQPCPCLTLPVADAPDWSLAQPLTGLLLQRGERVEAVCTSDEMEHARNLVIATRGGFVKVIPWSAADNLISGGHALVHPPAAGDTPAWVGECGNGDVLVATRSGKWTRFPIDSVETAGVQAFASEDLDDVACAVEIAPDHPVEETRRLIAVSDAGELLAAQPSAFAAHRKAGARASALPRGFRPVALFCCDTSSNIITVSIEGDLEVTRVADVPLSERLGDARLHRLFSPRLVAAALD